MPRKPKAAMARPADNATPLRPSTMAERLQQRQSQDLLRILTCGSVNDGKSTLIGRLLWESGHHDDQMNPRKTTFGQNGTQGSDIGHAPPLDGLGTERKHGNTAVTYRRFATAKRSFIAADIPGDERYTRNMLAAASNADVAVLLVDAQLGMLEQTRRDACLASLMGIGHLVLAVNKMDLLPFDGAVLDRASFDRIEAAFRLFAQPLGFASLTAIPVSALKGDNVVQRSTRTPWYTGPGLLDYLESVKVEPRTVNKLVFPLQSVSHDDASFASFSGSVAEGRVKVGDEIRVAASGQTTRVAEILTADGTPTEAVAGDAVTLRLDRSIDAVRGDVLGLSLSPLETTDQFEATLVWIGREAGLVGRSYDIELAAQRTSASITGIKYRVNVATQAHEACKTLELDDVGVCNLATGKPLAFDSYQNSRALGSFTLVDRLSHSTVAAGMIRHSLRRAQNVHRQPLSIARADRERLNRHKGRVVWFTGLPGSGKSTLANALEVALHALGRRTYLLDGDNVRQGLNRDLGFTVADRVENIRRIAEVAKLMMDAGLIVMTAFISPFRRERDMARELIGAEHFVEVYVSTPLAVCEQRDPKGLYKKARSGQLPNMTGVSSPYEAPAQADVTLDCSDAPLGAGVQGLIDALKF